MKDENVAGDDYRIGIKGLYDLYPSKIKEKFINDMKAKEWDEPHKKAIADAARDIEVFNAANNSSKIDKKCRVFVCRMEKSFLSTTETIHLQATICRWRTN